MAQATQQQSSKTNDNCCQILMCGDGGTGKSALAVGFIGGDLSQKYYDPTIHSQYHLSNFNVDGKIVGRIDIKDVQGQEEYLNIRLQTISDCDAFILVYDITTASTFHELDKWIKEIYETKLKENEYKGIPMVLVGMKCDLQSQRQVLYQDGQKLAQKLNNCPFYEASATSNQLINVQNIFESIIREWRKYEEYAVTKYSNKEKKRKQKSKMSNFLNGLGDLFKNNNIDENKQKPPFLEQPQDNDNKNNDDNSWIDEKKKEVVLEAEMDSIVEDMFKEQIDAHQKNLDALERQKADATPAGPDIAINNVNMVYNNNNNNEYEQEGMDEGKHDIEKTDNVYYPTPNAKTVSNENDEEKTNNDKKKQVNDVDDGNIDLCLYHFKQFLNDLKLSKYENIFIENGYGDLEKMLYLDDNDLKNEDFKMKTVDRKYLLKKLEVLNKEHEKFKNWLDNIVKLSVYQQSLFNKGIITMKILIESINVNNKNSLQKIIKFYSNDHLNIFWDKIQDYLHPSQSDVTLV